MKSICKKTGRYAILIFLGILGLIFGSIQANAVVLHPGFPVSSNNLNDAGSVGRSAVNYDYDRDGQVETIFGSDNGYVYFINSSGVVENQFGPLPGPCTEPSIADIDGDGRLEMVFGSEAYVDSVNTRAAIYAIRADMSLVPGFPAVIIGIADHGGIVYPPSLYDVDGDGRQEIFTGTSG